MLNQLSYTAQDRSPRAGAARSVPTRFSYTNQQSRKCPTDMSLDQANASHSLGELPHSTCVKFTAKIIVTPGKIPKQLSLLSLYCFVLCGFQGLQRVLAMGGTQWTHIYFTDREAKLFIVHRLGSTLVSGVVWGTACVPILEDPSWLFSPSTPCWEPPRKQGTTVSLHIQLLDEADKTQNTRLNSVSEGQ